MLQHHSKVTVSLSKNFTLIAKYYLVLGTDLRVISQSFLTQIDKGPNGRLTQMSN